MPTLCSNLVCRACLTCIMRHKKCCITAQSPPSWAKEVLHLLITDWTHSEDENAAAYARAGLPQWAESCLSDAGLPTEPAHQGSLQASVARQPASVVQATVSDVVLSLPHDQDFGRAERFCELWSKAFQQVCHTHCSFSNAHLGVAQNSVFAKSLDHSCVVLSLPHDQDFGWTERFCKLWSKAFGQVCSLRKC